MLVIPIECTSSSHSEAAIRAQTVLCLDGIHSEDGLGSGEQAGTSPGPEVCVVRMVLSALTHTLCRSLSISLDYKVLDTGTREHGVTSGRCNGVAI